MTPTPVREEHHPAGFAAADKMWDALYLARSGKSGQSVADLEDAAYRFYLPMARTIGRTFTGDSAAPVQITEQAAELGLARAILAWRQRTSGGFRRFARSAITREILQS